MLTIVRDNQYIAFTLMPNQAAICPAIQWFRELAPEWGADNCNRIALTLHEVLFRAIAQRSQQGRPGEMRCRIERNCDGPFKITVEDEPAWFDFSCVSTGRRDVSRNVSRRVHIGIRKLFRSEDSQALDNRITALVDTAETVKETLSAEFFRHSTRDAIGRNRHEGDQIHAADR